ncbi:amidophosphoribosyltransferase [Batrachochytrium salamandrivorans]|nr:amidophosphoribosyltransferase [Batrachochytrium salamandrivorans]
MCGVCGIVTSEEAVSPLILETLTSLQHRGQDAAGISTVDVNNRTHLIKSNGQVSEVFKDENQLVKLVGRYGLGHVRYPTAGTNGSEEAQPFYTNSPHGISLCHNGNLTNTAELRVLCRDELKRQINTESDSECMMAVFSAELSQLDQSLSLTDRVFMAVEKVMLLCKGAFGVVVSVAGLGLVGFRDPCGIRPLCFGERLDERGGGRRNGLMLSSESVALEVAGFTMLRDVNPGEAVLLTLDLELDVRQCSQQTKLSPCIFEYVYFARPDSVLDGVLVHQARVNMGEKLGKRIQSLFANCKIDMVVPVPSTSRTSALQCAATLGVPYVEALVRNRYSQRTFIMPGQKQRAKSVRLKLNPVSALIKGKSVLLVDDSIVRGTTSRHIVEIMRQAGATNVYFGSAAPAIRYPNVYGIDMPTSRELIAFGRTEKEIATAISADWVVFQAVPDLVSAVRSCNPKLRMFDMSCFDGVYCGGALPDEYFQDLNAERSDKAQAVKLVKSTSSLSVGF